MLKLFFEGEKEFERFAKEIRYYALAGKFIWTRRDACALYYLGVFVEPESDYAKAPLV